MNIQHFLSEDKWAKSTSSYIANLLQDSLTPSLALSGGSAATLYPVLACQKVPWKKVDIFLTDERYILSSHSDSNEKLIRETFPAPAIFHFWKTNLSWEECSREYNTLLHEEFSIKKTLDVAILGIGPDGHFASIFPQTLSSFSANKFAEINTTSAFSISERLTMTPSFLLSAKNIIILLRGSGKKEIFDELKNPTETPEEFPAHLLKNHPSCSLFFADI